jgi:rubrerythrin
MKMNGTPKILAIKIMAGGGKGEENGSYKEPATPAADMEEDTSESEATHWQCPECGTEVMATMEKSKMKCPCCGASMDQVED